MNFSPQGPCWGCPRGQAGPIHYSLVNGWLFLTFQRLCARSGLLADLEGPCALWMSQAQDCLLSLAGRAGLGTKLAYSLRFSHFISRTANFRPSEEAMATHVWCQAEPKSVPPAGHAAFRTISQPLTQLQRDRQHIPEGRRWNGFSWGVVHW